MNRKAVKVFLLLLLMGAFCNAQEADSGFWDGLGDAAPFGEPFWADMRSTLIRAELAYATNSPDYDFAEYNTSDRFYIFANLGADIPLWSGSFAGGKYGFCVTMPFAIDVWFDWLEELTSPIVNTSYRFGLLDAGFLYRLDSPTPVLPFFDFNIYNWGIELSLFNHESTHVGDELMIYRMKKDMPVKRIDVAYNYAELIFTLNDPDSQIRSNHGFKFGLLFNYLFPWGWYEIKASETDLSVVEEARFPFEIYAQYQYQSAFFSRGFQVIASAEYRFRQRYKYPFSYSGADNDPRQGNPPDFVNCFNLFAGIRRDKQKGNYFSKIGIGVRYYAGLNPYGQFRSMPYYRQLGLCALFE